MMKISSRNKEVDMTLADVHKEVFSFNDNVEYTSSRFSGILKDKLASEYDKIWVCGPPPMNEEMINLFDKLEIPPEKYLLV